MAKRTVHLHVGPAGAAADAIHGGLLEQRFALSAAGFHVPASSAYDALAIEIELCRTHREHGLRRSEVEGTWARLTREIWRSPRPALISIPGLAAAPPDGRALVFDALAGLKIHLVLTPPDPGTALTTAWRSAVRTGRRTSFAKFARRALDAQRTHDYAQQFHRTYDLTALLDAWAPRMKPQRVHVLTAPPPGSNDSGGAAGPVAWRRYAALLGLEPGDTPPAPIGALGADEPIPAPDPREIAAEVAVLRRVNRALDGRLNHPSYASVVAPLLGDLAPIALPDLGPDPHTAPLRDVLNALGHTWVAEVAQRGHQLHGDPADLLPLVPETAPHPDRVDAEEQLGVATDLLAEALLDLAELRRDLDRLSRAEGPGRRGLLRRRALGA